MTDQDRPKTGQAEDMGDGIRRILAPNPSPMTYWGTNTYMLGEKDLLVIDPGPDDDQHLQAILDAVLDGQKITKIVVTHSHIDHSPLARRLADQTGATIYAFGGPQAGRSDVMADLADRGFLGGGEGVDATFAPDEILTDGQFFTHEALTLEAIHTPGHFGNHICLALGDICFCGDHVMGWSSSLVSPPDGDLTDFMTSCEKLAKRDWRRLHAGHGLPIEAPNERLQWLMSHRRKREGEILAALHVQADTAEGVAARIYTDVDQRLLPIAARNVFAHLVDLTGRGLVTTPQHIEFTSEFKAI